MAEAAAFAVNALLPEYSECQLLDKDSMGNFQTFDHYRATYLHLEPPDSFGSKWAVTVASYCPGWMVVHPKSKPTGGFNQPDWSPVPEDDLSSAADSRGAVLLFKLNYSRGLGEPSINDVCIYGKEGGKDSLV